MSGGLESLKTAREPFEFGSKAETLARLRNRLGGDHFCDQFVVSLEHWRRDAEGLVEQCLMTITAEQLAVRSSALAEDTADSSMAGAFHSVLGVAANPGSLRKSIEDVIDSYGASRSEADQVLIQPMIHDVAISGVIVTRDLDSGAPYYVINYDDITGRTDSVTGGSASKTVLVHRSRPDRLKSERLQRLVAVVQDIEAEAGDDRLDIEFCITIEGSLFILQVRPLATQRNWSPVADHQVDNLIEGVRTALAARMTPENGILGDTTIFGQMPDWNPAEMIGSRPRPLAYSLYHRQITSSAWAEARYRMGYRDMREQALMAGFAGQPFIDVRLSLNSFLPAGLDDAIGRKLVNAQIGRLAENRDLHDRIEFEIAFPNYDFRFGERLEELREAGLDSSEINSFKKHIMDITVRQIRDWDVSSRSIKDRISRLDEVEQLAATKSPIEAVQMLLDNCVPFGTVPFAEAARHGFIGVSLLNSLVSVGALSENESAGFLASIETVAHDLIRDMAALQEGNIERDDFLKDYGHLRPGTYDVTSYRYDERPDLYLSGGSTHCEPQAEFSISDGARSETERLAVELEGLKVETLLDYVRGAVELREWAKFKFTRTISEVLRALGRFGEENDLDRDAVSYLTIQQILETDGEQGWFEDKIAASREANHVNRMVRLPHVIISPVDVDVIRVPLGKPTFITQDSITAPAVHLETINVVPIEGRIVLIESADPGFDWIFSHNIAGLITKFGGANSHMAIRCAEFLTPAAIGCGERLFDRLASAEVVVLNCAAHSVEPS